MRSLIACLLGLVASNAAATDYPTTGMLYNQQEDSSLTYNTQELSGGCEGILRSQGMQHGGRVARYGHRSDFH